MEQRESLQLVAAGSNQYFHIKFQRMFDTGGGH